MILKEQSASAVLILVLNCVFLRVTVFKCYCGYIIYIVHLCRPWNWLAGGVMAEPPSGVRCFSGKGPRWPLLAPGVRRAAVSWGKVTEQALLFAEDQG